MTFPVIFRSYKKKAASGPTTLILDEFTDTNGTALTAHTIAPTNVPVASWGATLNLSGNVNDVFTIQSNKGTYVNAQDQNENAGTVLNAGVADCVITATVTTANRNVTYPQGFLGRYSAANSCWVFFADVSGDTINITQNYTGTLRASAVKVIAANTAYAFTVTLSGNNLTLDVAGTSCTYASSTNNTVTSHGLIAYSRASASTTFDDFTVTA